VKHPEPRVGLEVHVQLGTATKLFCADRNTSAAPPNTCVCPVCLGLPGALPVTAARPVELALRVALALGCRIHEESAFARKSYFYPDLPKGYQVTQHDRPLATGGCFAVPTQGGVRRVRIRRVHLEEDAGRLLHDRVPGGTAVDFNRAGVPLVEIVTEPEPLEPLAARHFLERLRQLLRYLGVSDCDMEAGTLRVDANVSLAGPGGAAGTRTELKNLNSFSAVAKALAWELRRQQDRVESGGEVEAETLLWDVGRGEARPMRRKEGSHEYRYFREPDLPPIRVDAALLEAARRGWPELPLEREARFRAQYGLTPREAAVLTAEAAVADYFEAAAAAARVEARVIAGWVLREVLAWLNRHGQTPERLPVGPAALAELAGLVAGGSLSRTAGGHAFRRMAETGASAASVVGEQGLRQVRDPARLGAWVDAAIAAHPAEAERVRGGDERVLAFLMGDVMRRSGGRADPRLAAQLFAERLGSRASPAGSAGPAQARSIPGRRSQ
jgi:aspartyl-tRNA(Asn)/glutamyl-tRNA(Gln) amidotransferase subunit B